MSSFDGRSFASQLTKTFPPVVEGAFSPSTRKTAGPMQSIVRVARSTLHSGNYGQRSSWSCTHGVVSKEGCGSTGGRNAGWRLTNGISIGGREQARSDLQCVGSVNQGGSGQVKCSDNLVLD